MGLDNPVIAKHLKTLGSVPWEDMVVSLIEELTNGPIAEPDQSSPSKPQTKKAQIPCHCAVGDTVFYVTGLRENRGVTMAKILEIYTKRRSQAEAPLVLCTLSADTAWSSPPLPLPLSPYFSHTPSYMPCTPIPVVRNVVDLIPSKAGTHPFNQYECLVKLQGQQGLVIGDRVQTLSTINPRGHRAKGLIKGQITKIMQNNDELNLVEVLTERGERFITVARIWDRLENTCNNLY